MDELNTLLLFGILLTIVCLCASQPFNWKLKHTATSRAVLKKMETRNMYQCERLCIRFKPCVSISYSLRSRRCSLFMDEFADHDVSPNRAGIVSNVYMSNMSSVADVSSRCPVVSFYAASGRQAICLTTTAARDCQEVLEADDAAPDGVYIIRPDGSGLFEVYCDMTDDGGGWTVLQRRADGSENFFRNWEEYKNGFGKLENEFWLGNDNIFHLSNQKDNHLKIVMEDSGHSRENATYSKFRIEDESGMYRLTVNGYSGSAGDSLARHNNMAFSTKDVDNDNYGSKNCAEHYLGGWWYEDCHDSNLNGEYNNRKRAKGVIWRSFTGYYKPLKYVEMKIRP